MTREEIFDAFRKAASEEFECIPDEKSIDYNFSKTFDKKIESVFHHFENGGKHPISKLSKMIIAVAAAVVLILAGLMSVSAIREPVVNYIVKKYEALNAEKNTVAVTESPDDITLSEIEKYTEAPGGESENNQVTTASRSEKPTKANPEPTEAFRGSAKESTLFVPNEFAGYDNSVSVDSHITKKYNADEIVRNHIFYENKSEAQSFVWTYEMLNDIFPVECLRSCDGNVYAVYEIEQGGYFYAFFNDRMEVANTAYMTKKLSYSDFGNITQGTDASRVETLEPAAEYILDMGLAGPYITVILTDGVIRVYFEKGENGYTVSGVKYYDDFMLIYDSNNLYCELNYKILDGDYPQ